MIRQPVFFVTEPMHNWMSFLEQQGARDIDATTSSIGSFGSNSAGVPPMTDFLVPLTGFGLIDASGDDAASFLHNQLTNDVSHLGINEARLAGYCTPKGRLMATFLMWQTEGKILLQLPRELQPAIQKRLQMFIMRAKATLTDAGEQKVQLGLAGPAATAALKTWFPELPATPYAKVDGNTGTLIRLADTADIDNAAAAGVARYLWVLDAEAARAAWPTLATVLQPVGAAVWQLAEVRAAIPVVTAATQDRFVPQMINFEAVGGVNFQKGCFPGQEIVARSQYLGKLKRRMMPATVESMDASAGMEVFSSEDPDQACGTLVSAAPNGITSSACLVEIKLAALAASVHLGSIDGPLLQFHALPYVLADADRPDLR